MLGGRPITVGDAAYLDDGTLAGSVLTMDRAFALLVERDGLSLVDAATVCSTTPARALGLEGFGVIAARGHGGSGRPGPDLTVTQTWIAGSLIWSVIPVAEQTVHRDTYRRERRSSRARLCQS